jgi:hypothetical protein
MPQNVTALRLLCNRPHSAAGPPARELRHSIGTLNPAALDTRGAGLDTPSMRKPNVLVFICDDIGFNEIGACQGRGMPDRDVYQGRRVHTPNLDAIAREGALLTRYYATSAICTPSRYSVLTGRYASRSPSILETFPAGTAATITWNTRVDRSESNLAKAFKAMGYATGFVGKWHNSTPANYRGIEHGPEDPVDDRFLAEVRAAYERGVSHLRDGFGFDYVDRLYDGNREGFPHPFQVHNLEWIAEGAIDFMEASRDKPFFLYMATSAPHGDYFTDFTKVDPRYTPAGILDERPHAMPPRETLHERVRAAGCSETTAMSTWIDECLGPLHDPLAGQDRARDRTVEDLRQHRSGRDALRAGGRIAAGRPSDRRQKLCVPAARALCRAGLAGASDARGLQHSSDRDGPLEVHRQPRIR